jgi:HD-GYP domain-containing protein (c-di-GMP phosphodiesterase class II)
MIRLSISQVKSGLLLGKNIYNAEGKLLLGKGQVLKEEYIEKLKSLKISFLYIEDERTKEAEVEDVISERTRLELTWTVKKIMDRMKIKKRITNSQVREVKQVVNQMVDELSYHQNLLVNFQDIRSYDDYLYCHSVGTAILSVILGIAFMYDEIRLRDLGVGALLHDIGKIKISKEILNKPDKLNREEWEEVKKHPIFGYEILYQNEELSLLSSHVAYQHHEYYNGGGYPRGLREEEIITYAKITGICDVYDALTCDRVYRKKFLPHEAMKIIIDLAGKQFSPHLVKVFLEHIALYPIGTQVELNTGEIGVVIRTIKGFTDKPLIKILKDKEGKELENPRIVNLMEDTSLSIQKVIE